MLYREADFLDEDACRQIRRAMDLGIAEEAEIAAGATEPRDTIRRAVSVEIDADVVRQVEARLDARRDTLAGFFGIGLSDREGAGFLRYLPGGFYAPHRDRADVASWPGAALRAIAVIAFLNGSREVEANGEFRGGVLRLFVEGEAIDVHPRQGQLIAFRADTLHEVTEVIGGARDVIVDWFYGPL